MFHAARAVLFRTTGTAPKRHGTMIGQFGLLVRDLDTEFRGVGRAFNDMRDQRNAADYEMTCLPPPDDARKALATARAFLALCGERYGWPSSSG